MCQKPGAKFTRSLYPVTCVTRVSNPQFVFFPEEKSTTESPLDVQLAHGKALESSQAGATPCRLGCKAANDQQPNLAGSKSVVSH